ncbi:hypothetical protein Mgra_00008577 [Meloidogyne graminicola]|uniref:Uncharacterized protein n=1 Tax=Meloidogyne graminicola TaxID=189291 RepID=A0A8S9ZFD7_9BILA|nr:hypothetical protein Mgra_00008577 [Meloidogyne graminicola]
MNSFAIKLTCLCIILLFNINFVSTADTCKVGSCPCAGTACSNGAKWNCNPFGGCLCSYVPLGACLWTAGVCCSANTGK